MATPALMEVDNDVCEGLSKLSSYFTLYHVKVEKLKRFNKNF